MPNPADSGGVPTRVLICSGFFESSLPSYREYAYSSELVRLGYDVTLMCGDRSQIWARSRVKLTPTNPMSQDQEFVRSTGVQLLRRHVFMRYSDFVLYRPQLKAIRDADIVHIIEFRQGVTVLVAILAKMFGKPVVYDHEQRGDRTEKWYSRVDSILRRVLIAVGSTTVERVRHTVLANLKHFRANSLRSTESTFAPLGADPTKFYFDAQERADGRRRLGIGGDERCAIVSGKIHHFKRIPDVVRACQAAGWRLLIVGDVAADVAGELRSCAGETTTILPPVDAAGLRALYAVADLAIFTTFTLSYWEALATGAKLLVPRTEFTKFALDNDPTISFYGEPALFSIPDEQYREDAQIEPLLTAALRTIAPGDHAPNLRFSSPNQVAALAESYEEILSRRRPMAMAAR